MRIPSTLAAIWFAANMSCGAFAQDFSCINIYHDEISDENPDRGPLNAIMLANLLGHWPQYEVRVRPIKDYSSSDLEACKATIYLGTSDDTEVPLGFRHDFFTTSKRVAWVGFGVAKLDQTRFETAFHHRVVGQVDVDDPKAKDPAFYQYVSYKGSLLRKDGDTSGGKPEGAYEAIRFDPSDDKADSAVLARLIHNKTHDSIPYFLRSDTRFIVGDVPFAYMHESDRYFAFADLLFDILDEKPLRQRLFAFLRTEDVHEFCERPLLDAVFSAQISEGVPISINQIPMFMDPLNTFGLGKIEIPRPASEGAEFVALMASIAKDKRNTIIWHGVTHQFGLVKNPHTGTSGDDYEFWNMVANRPVDGDSVNATLDRLSLALPVFSAFGLKPRFWVAPHYQASALDNRVFAEVFPWSVGRSTYYTSSFKPTFIIPATNRNVSLSMPSVTPERLEELKKKDWTGLDLRSEEGETQLFPFEIYRDVYGQRIIPETLNYLSYSTTDQTAFIRTADDMLADARRNLVVRDYWASFFYHPYIFASREDGGIGRYTGDTLELRKLLIGLKLLGYSFVGLSDFEASLPTKNDGFPQPAQANASH